MWFAVRNDCDPRVLQAGWCVRLFRTDQGWIVYRTPSLRKFKMYLTAWDSYTKLNGNKITTHDSRYVFLEWTCIFFNIFVSFAQVTIPDGSLLYSAEYLLIAVDWRSFCLGAWKTRRSELRDLARKGWRRRLGPDEYGSASPSGLMFWLRLESIVRNMWFIINGITRSIHILNIPVLKPVLLLVACGHAHSLSRIRLPTGFTKYHR